MAVLMGAVRRRQPDIVSKGDIAMVNNKGRDNAPMLFAPRAAAGFPMPCQGRVLANIPFRLRG
jgi:hypothetical protein